MRSIESVISPTPERFALIGSCERRLQSHRVFVNAFGIFLVRSVNPRPPTMFGRLEARPFVMT
jgi:hypothetical protein